MLGTCLFIATEAMLFTGLGGSFSILRSQYTTWPPLGQPRLPVEATAVYSLILVASGFACERAARAARVEDRLRWLGITLVLGSAFLLAQGQEWWALVGFGLSASSVFGDLFYALVGTHALHVLGSVALLAYATFAVQRGRWGGVELGAVRLWWWFVVLVWPAIYALVYLA